MSTPQLTEYKEKALAWARERYPEAKDIRPCLSSGGEFLAEVKLEHGISVVPTGVFR